MQVQEEGGCGAPVPFGANCQLLGVEGVLWLGSWCPAATQERLDRKRKDQNTYTGEEHGWRGESRHCMLGRADERLGAVCPETLEPEDTTPQDSIPLRDC